MSTAEITTTEQAATVAEQGAHVAPEKTTSKKAATKKAGPTKGQKKAHGKAKVASPTEPKAKKTPKAPRTMDAGTLRPESKAAKVLELICRAKGASLTELMKATGWQSHSVRGFISGTLGKKMGHKVASAKREDGERVYSMSR
jgi:hypothetical protein